MRKITYYTLNESATELNKNTISSSELEAINNASTVKLELTGDSLGGSFPVLTLSTESEITIEDPSLSDCGRFSVNPIQEYNLTKEQVELMSKSTFNSLGEEQYNEYIIAFLSK